jgi:threonylcarbamoyladenosine tRNA methylthiotransferase MtaB
MIPGLAVTTDVIAGFPGETDADHRRSLAFAAGCGFARMHVFRYSPRKGTPAAAMACQVAPAVRAARAGELRGLGAAMESRRATGRVGEEADVLVERVEGRVAVGTSEDHLRVTVGSAHARAGDVVRVVLTGWGPEGMRGDPLV